MVFCYTVDSSYLRYSKASLKSLIKNNPGKHSVCFVSRDDVTQDEDWSDLVMIANNAGWILNYFPLNFGGYTPDFIHSRSWSEPSYYRLWLYCSLPDEISKVIYLDTDVLCKGDLTGLWTTDLTNKIFGASHDYSPTPEGEINGKLIIGDMENIHSGVLLLNLTYWRNHATEIQALYQNSDKDPVLRGNSPTPYIQTMPDWLFDGWFIQKLGEMFPYAVLPLRYNFHTEYYLVVEQEFNGAMQLGSYIPAVSADAYLQDVLSSDDLIEYKNVKLLHYSGGIKPWMLPNAVF